MSCWQVRLRLLSQLTNHSTVTTLGHMVLVGYHRTFRQSMGGNGILEATPLSYQKIKESSVTVTTTELGGFTGNTGALRVSSMMSKWTHE